MLDSVSAVLQSIYEFIELGNDIHDHPSLEINYEENQSFEFKQQGKIIHGFYDPVLYGWSHCYQLCHIVQSLA